MKGLLKYTVIIAFVFAMFSSVLVQPTHAQANSEDNDTIYINEWEMKWEINPDATIEDIMSDEQAEGWFPVSYEDDLPDIPEGIKTAWLRLDLPDRNDNRSALLINQLVAKDALIYINKKEVFSSYRNYSYNKNEVLLPINHDEKNASIYLRLATSEDLLGIRGQVAVGEFQVLSQGYMKLGILDVILGASLVIISVTMFISVLFVKRDYLVGWNSLSTVILSIGLMILTYSPFTHSVMREYGEISYYL
ncbi:hypothetical protein AB4Z33_23625, partial [Paenibacillus sp. 2TAB19]